MKYVISKSVAVALLTMGLVASSFGFVTFNWVNDGSGLTTDICPLYLGSNGPVALSPGVANTVGDGYLVQLVALSGGTNFVLASATVGDGPAALSDNVSLPYNGYFDLTSSISTDLLAAVSGSPMAVVFYAGTTTASPHAVVSNPTIHVPSPSSSGTYYFDLDYGNTHFIGSRIAAGPGHPHGWFVEPIPEPSTLMLAGLGLLGAVGLCRRHRS
jgi:hypothetical protein